MNEFNTVFQSLEPFNEYRVDALGLTTLQENWLPSETSAFHRQRIITGDSISAIFHDDGSDRHLDKGPTRAYMNLYMGVQPGWRIRLLPKLNGLTNSTPIWLKAALSALLKVRIRYMM
ncbi:hypothetical protein EYZ11_002056 [Aspergillus tanneri]|uniref:Uncharacterized protein n=1 Tax=Aspergillus tanneri TaxID=1220188 RepID=A0A4S3JU69_9EURO|nr:hypothetical protein EYZ11_002056 [Aspergillus tanneri]